MTICRAQWIFDQLEQPPAFNRPGQISISTCGQTSLPISLHGVSCHGQDRNSTTGVVLHRPDRRRGLQSIHYGHWHIHQNHVERLALNPFYRLVPTVGDDHFVVMTLEHIDDQLLVHGRIFGQPAALGLNFARPSLELGNRGSPDISVLANRPIMTLGRLTTS